MYQSKLFRHSIYSPHDEFKFIYYKDWVIGMKVQCNKDGNIIELGTLIEKILTSNPRDPDTVLTFEQSDVRTVHWVDLGAKYRQYKD